MPIYSEPNTLNPVLFDVKLGNCYRFFNDAFRSLESYLENYLTKTEQAVDDEEQEALIDEIRRDFLTAYVLLGDDDRSLSDYRLIFIQYAFISALLQNTAQAARFFDSRQGPVERRFLPDDEMHFYSLLAKAASGQGEMVVIDEKDVTGIGNLAMFAALNKGICTCISSDFMRLTANDFLLRFILSNIPEGSPLLDHLGVFSWVNLPEELIGRRGYLFAPALALARGELDVGKRYVLKSLINSCKDYAIDGITVEFFRLGYRHYNQMFEETTKILDAKAKEFELYHLYGGSNEELPSTWHFKGMPSDDFAAAFSKNSFSQREIDALTAVQDSGLLACLLDQIYYFNPTKDFPDSRVIKFVFDNYPRAVYADFAQFSGDAVNYFWLPEMPSKILNSDGSEFYSAARVKKLKTRGVTLKFGFPSSGTLAKILEEPFRGLFMHAYGVRFNEAPLTADFFEDNPAFSEFVLYLRNLSREMCRKSALYILKHAGFMNPEAKERYAEPALNQLMFIAPDMDTLKILAAQSLGGGFGSHILALLDVLDLKGPELLSALGERDFGQLVSALMDREKGGIFFHPSVAENLDKMLREGRLDRGDQAFYLSASYLSHNFSPEDGSLHPMEEVKGLLPELMSPEMELSIESRFLSAYLNSRLKQREFGDEFYNAFEKLWTLTDKDVHNEAYKDEACSIIWRMLAQGDSPFYARFAPYVKKISEMGQNDSSVVREFLLYCKIKNGEALEPSDSEQMFKLYMAQGIVTARTKTVVGAIGAGKQLAEELIAFDWVKADPAWTDVEITTGDYSDILKAGGPESYSGQNLDYTYVFRVGYVNVYNLNYTFLGERHTELVRRNLEDWERNLIFQRAWEFIDSKAGADVNFLLFAGRLCVDMGFFEADILFEYIAHISKNRDMRSEVVRGISYILSNQNALTKSCLFAPDSTLTRERLKGFFATCFAFWSDAKKITGLRPLFAYVRSLEYIVGKSRLGGLNDYLKEQILNNPHTKPDLSEEYRIAFLER